MQPQIPKCSPETLIFMAMEYKKTRKMRLVTIEEIFNDVCSIFNQPQLLVKSKNRRQQFSKCRSIICYVCSLLTNLTLKQIGEYLGDRDHTTALHGRDKVKNFLHIKDSRFMSDWELYTSSSPIWKEYLKSKND